MMQFTAEQLSALRDRVGAGVLQIRQNQDGGFETYARSGVQVKWGPIDVLKVVKATAPRKGWSYTASPSYNEGNWTATFTHEDSGQEFSATADTESDAAVLARIASPERIP